MSRNTSDTQQPDQFLTGLQAWVDEAPEGERPYRVSAMRRIIECRNWGRENLSLENSRLSSLPKEIGDLAALKSLDLRNNQLTTIPTWIGNLTALDLLDLGENQLTTIPAEIGRLTALTSLSLAQNQLTTFPAEIGRLTALTSLSLAQNQLTTIPAEIGNLTALEYLSLDENQLTTIPASVMERRNGGMLISLENNRITAAEAQRLRQLASANGVVLRFSFIDDFQPTTTAQQAITATITDQILSKSSSEEEKKTLRTFLESTVPDFQRFLAECPRTQGWQSKKEEMVVRLFEIVKKMSQSEVVKTKCETLAATAFDTCGDRVALAFVQMQLSLNLSDKKLEEMSVQEVYDYAKQESVIKFLSEKSAAKVEQIKARGGGLDEIETHLAYLQIAPDLGLDLKANDMLYQRCSNVTEKELEETKTEFLALDREHLIAEHIYEDGQLRLHPFVKEIIAEVSGREEFGADKKEEEKEQVYMERLASLQAVVAQATISEIQEALSSVNEAEIQINFTDEEKEGEEKEGEIAADLEEAVVQETPLIGNVNENEILNNNQLQAPTEVEEPVNTNNTPSASPSIFRGIINSIKRLCGISENAKIHPL